MNIFGAMAVKDLDEATRAMSVIDFSPAFLGEPGGLDTVAAQVRPACESVGFFYLAGHASAVYRDLVLAFYNANYFLRKDFAGHPTA